MLDLKTVLIITLAAASLQAVSWFAVWRAWRHLYELKFIAAGFFAIAAGVLMFFLRGESPAPWAIVLHNFTIKLGLVLFAEGLARFLGQPRYSWIGVALLISQFVIWSAAVAVDPGNLAIRVHSSTFFTIVMMSVMCLGLMRDRTQPQLLRWIMIALLVEYMPMVPRRRSLSCVRQSPSNPCGGDGSRCGAGGARAGGPASDAELCE
jgi:hypothetical protein